MLKGSTTRSGVTIQGPKTVNHDTEVTKDTMPPANNGSTEDVQPPVVQIQSRNPNPEPNVSPVDTPIPKVSIPFPSRRNDDSHPEQVCPKKTWTTPADSLSHVNFLALTHANACPDLGASINLMPYSVWKDLSFRVTPNMHDARASGVRSITKYTNRVQHQRRVNPKIHDVIKKEVEKLLDAGLIYPISDSPWVSPIHCVPKKGGFTVVQNEENELILTRLVTGWRTGNASTIVSLMDSPGGISKFPLNPRDQKRPTIYFVPTESFASVACLSAYAMHQGTVSKGLVMLAFFHDMVEKDNGSLSG
ncbi:hypothetical protein Tco_0566832 [Tanacetum coccineum]